MYWFIQGVTHRAAARATDAVRTAENQARHRIRREQLSTLDPGSICNPDSSRYPEEEVEKQVSEYDDQNDVDQFDDARLSLSSVVQPCRGLSPLVEVSSEMTSAESIESMELELDAALSHLSDVTCGMEEAVLESRQTKITETVKIEPRERRKQLFSERRASSYEGWYMTMSALVLTRFVVISVSRCLCDSSVYMGIYFIFRYCRSSRCM